MTNLVYQLKPMLLVEAFCALAVLMAVAIDLGSGLYKAKQRGEVRTSYAYSRTTMKLITNEGAVIIMAMMDVLLFYGHLWDVLHLDVLHSVPVFTVITSVWMCFVQAVSVRENAESKGDKKATDQLIAIIRTMRRKDVDDILRAMGKLKEQ